MMQDNGEQARIIGEYEDKTNIPFGSRITWPYYLLDVYVFKPGVRPEQIRDRIETVNAKQMEREEKSE